MITAPKIESLPARLAQNLDSAFPDLVKLLSDDVFSGCLRMLGHRADAEDITQDALLRAYRALSGYPPERINDLKLRGWVWTIAANLCRNRLRSRGRKPEAELAFDPIEADPGPAEHAVAAEGREALAELVATLPWEMKAAVVLRHVVGLPYGEIADALDRPVGTVKSDVHRGLERLRSTHKESS